MLFKASTKAKDEYLALYRYLTKALRIINDYHNSHIPSSEQCGWLATALCQRGYDKNAFDSSWIKDGMAGELSSHQKMARASMEAEIPQIKELFDGLALATTMIYELYCGSFNQRTKFKNGMTMRKLQKAITLILENQKINNLFG